MAQTLRKATSRRVPEWQNQPSWRILDCSFPQGDSFSATLLKWHQDPHRPRMLHYVALTPAWADLQPGFHRFSLSQGRVLLTLCVGEAQTLLRELAFAADTVFIDFSCSDEWDNWHFKALARCCRRGTYIEATRPSQEHQEGLQAVGFEMDGNVINSNQIDSKVGLFNPGWELKTARQPWHQTARKPGQCIVLGAGLAGASAAAALSRRGWQVQVLDAAPHPAAGASGLPVGLVEPHVSKDDSPRSRLSRSGLQLTFEYARRWLKENSDWALTGVMNVVMQTWQANAAWIKPEKLVHAWLSEAGIEFVGNTNVASIEFNQGRWQLRDAHGVVMAQTELLVLACATQTAEILRASGLQTPACENVPGVVHWARQSDLLSKVMPKHPVNGKGSLIPGVPQPQGLAWYVGATYETHSRDPAQERAENLERLNTLWPQASTAIPHELFAWRGQRCVSHDRLPVAGCLMEGLWISTAMGSRGLTFAALCAELLAAELNGEPLPVEASLARALKPGRAAAQTR